MKNRNFDVMEQNVEKIDKIDPMDLYLDEIGQDLDLMKIYLLDIGRTKLLSREEEVDLAKRIAEGDTKAKEHLINANLRLVVNIAKEYSDRGMPMSDLIQEGSIGLMDAADKFDHSKGYRFSTYATKRIKSKMSRAA